MGVTPSPELVVIVRAHSGLAGQQCGARSGLSPLQLRSCTASQCWASSDRLCVAPPTPLPSHTPAQAATAAERLQPADLALATVTVSNIGAIGGWLATPLAIPPQVCILALGRIRPALCPDTRIARSVMGLSWGGDHRVLDGAGLAAASNALKRLLDEPARMLLHDTQ